MAGSSSLCDVLVKTQHQEDSKRKCESAASSVSTMDRMNVRKNWRSQEMSVMCSCLMDFIFDLHVFHCLEWSKATDLKLSWVKE